MGAFEALFVGKFDDHELDVAIQPAPPLNFQKTVGQFFPERETHKFSPFGDSLVRILAAWRRRRALWHFLLRRLTSHRVSASR